MKQLFAASLLVSTLAGPPAIAHVAERAATATAARDAAVAPPHYAPYAFLVGEWSVGPADAAAFAVARIRWGPGRSYLWYAVSTLDGDSEHPHMEGMMVWNAARGDLDVLMVLDLEGGRAQERGRASVREDGTVVREVTSTFATGEGEGTGEFRQTFEAAGADRIRTAILRRTKEGWEPTFPGSDRFVMTRRPAPR